LLALVDLHLRGRYLDAIIIHILRFKVKRLYTSLNMS